MLLCQVFFGLLQLSSLETKLRGGMLGIADTAAKTLADDLSMGLRLGKRLGNFYNLRNLLPDAHRAFPMAHDICVTDATGNRIMAVPDAPENGFVPIDKSFLNRASSLNSRPAGHDLYYVAKPLKGRNDVPQGYVLIRLQASTLEKRIMPAITVIARNILLAMAVTVAASLLIMRLVPFFTIQGGLNRKHVYMSFGLLFAVVLLASSVVNHATFRREYLSIAMDNSRTMGQAMRETLHRPISKGVPVSLLNAVEEYFEAAAAKTSGSVLIELYRPDGVPAFSSRKAFSGESVVPGSSSDIGISDAANPEGHASWVLRTSLSQAVFGDAVREDVFNSVSLCVISLTLLFELLLLFCLLLERRAQVEPISGAAWSVDSGRYNTTLRLIFFMFMLALDMSVTFIPLRMAELPSGFFGLPRNVVMGLPVSAEVVMAGICIFVTGRWVSRYGAALPMSFGFMLAAMGYLTSALASGPMGFILARALAGAGYGTAVMAAQAYVYRSGGLAGLFAGVFAGSLCGGAAGSMLAEKLGFGVAFYTSSVMMLLLAALPYMLLRQGDTAKESEPPGPLGKKDYRRAVKSLGSGQFLALSLFALVPATFIVMGFTKYFMPVYLSRTAVAQADIGRVYMVYCLVLIYLGPPLGKAVLQARRKAPAVTAGGVLGALSILPLAVFDSLWATVMCAFILGVANAVNIPAHAEYLLRLDITAQLGSNQALGLLNVMERVGQALAPIVIGLLISVFLVQDIALWGGFFLLLLTVAFSVTRVRE
jgi:MFS family permease